MLKANTGAGSSMLALPGQRSSMVNVPDIKASTPNKANEHNNKLGQSSSSSKLVMTGSQFVDPNGAEKMDTGN
jgi:hypothetical protein